MKWRLKLGAVSSQRQHAVLVDLAAKVLADKLCALMCAAAHASAHASPDMRCSTTSALHILQPALPRLLLASVNLPTLLQDTLSMIARNPQTSAAWALHCARRCQVQTSQIWPSRGDSA